MHSVCRTRNGGTVFRGSKERVESEDDVPAFLVESHDALACFFRE